MTTTPNSLIPAPCASCAGFEVDRASTCTAKYLPSGSIPSPGRIPLCASCAANTRIYCDIRPIAEAAPQNAPHTFPSWYQRLLDLDMTCEDWKNFEAKAYLGYTRYCGSMHEAPMDLDKWLSRFRQNPIEVLFYQNDSRHDLASRVNSYTRIIGVLFA